MFDLSTIPPVLFDHFKNMLTWCNRVPSGPNVLKACREEGLKFADWLNPTWPDAIVALRLIGTEEGMPWSGQTALEAMIWIGKQVPLLWQQVSAVPDGEARIREFLAGMLAWTPAPEEMEEEPEEPEGSETTLQ